MGSEAEISDLPALCPVEPFKSGRQRPEPRCPVPQPEVLAIRNLFSPMQSEAPLTELGRALAGDDGKAVTGPPGSLPALTAAAEKALAEASAKW